MVGRQGRLKKETYFSFKVFLVLILFHYLFFDKKLMVPQVLLVNLHCVLTFQEKLTICVMFSLLKSYNTLLMLDVLFFFRKLVRQITAFQVVTFSKQI